MLKSILPVYLYFFKFFLSKPDSTCGAQTHSPEIKRSRSHSTDWSSQELLFIFTFFFKFKYYERARKRERERERAGDVASREREEESQAGSVLSAQTRHRAQSHELWDHDLSLNQELMFNRLLTTQLPLFLLLNVVIGKLKLRVWLELYLYWTAL